MLSDDKALVGAREGVKGGDLVGLGAFLNRLG
jgi:hypothetical protein